MSIHILGYVALEILRIKGAYTPEQLKALLDDAGFTQTEIHRKRPSYATILGEKS
jgi:hypothetical protein